MNKRPKYYKWIIWIFYFALILSIDSDADESCLLSINTEIHTAQSYIYGKTDCNLIIIIESEDAGIYEEKWLKFNALSSKDKLRLLPVVFLVKKGSLLNLKVIVSEEASFGGSKKEILERKINMNEEKNLLIIDRVKCHGLKVLHDLSVEKENPL